MKKVLYLSNLEVPYRVRFFEMLSQQPGIALTVLFECRKTLNRNNAWIESQRASYDKQYLGGVRLVGEHCFSLRIIGWLRRGWDLVIVGGYNSPVQSFAILVMRVLGIPFAISNDGESFIGTGFKSQLKKLFLRGPKFYLAAGHKSCQELQQALHPQVPIYVYHFSSLSRDELCQNMQLRAAQLQDYVLVVGANFHYKGMDVALDAARLDPSIRYRLVGMGRRTDLFLQQHPDIPENVEVIPFLQTEELYRAYAECRLCVLPSRQECWGLVVNEAASFGTPIVSTWGSGASKEFIADRYPQYLAKPGDAQSLYECISRCLDAPDADEYSRYLLDVSQRYCLETNVEVHKLAIDDGLRPIDN